MSVGEFVLVMRSGTGGSVSFTGPTIGDVVSLAVEAVATLDLGETPYAAGWERRLEEVGPLDPSTCSGSSFTAVRELDVWIAALHEGGIRAVLQAECDTTPWDEGEWRRQVSRRVIVMPMCVKCTGWRRAGPVAARE